MRNIGTRFLLADYKTTIGSLIFRAKRITFSEDMDDVSRELQLTWLPMSSRDKRTRWIVACHLARWFLDNHQVLLNVDRLTDDLFGGDVPEYIILLRSLLADPDEDLDPTPEPSEHGEGEEGGDDATPRPIDPHIPGGAPAPLPPYRASRRFDFLFESLGDANAWVNAFNDDRRQATLNSLGLFWSDPAAGDLDFNFLPKREVNDILEPWIILRPRMVNFVTTSSGQHGRTAATGGLAQFSKVKIAGSEIHIASLINLLAPEYSLLACFPPEAATDPTLRLDVSLVHTTNVDRVATEFLERDWAT